MPAIPDPSSYWRPCCKPTRIIDGDSFDAYLDLGWHHHHGDPDDVIEIRCWGYNAPEHNQPGGPEATAWLASMLLIGGAYVIRSYDHHFEDNFGRTLADVVLADGSLLSEQAVATGHGVPYFGGPR